MTARRRPKPLRQLGQALFALTLLAAVFLAGRLAQQWDEPPGVGLPADAAGPCRVHKVVDGDTVRMRCAGRGDEMKVRLLRIDTPEREQPGYREATRALRGLLADRDVYFAYENPGQPTRGNYGRLLAYLYADGNNVNVEMVRAGWSRFDTRWGEGRFARAFREAEREASRAGRL